MLLDILKDPKFDYAFSALMGIFLMLLARPVCKGDACFNFKAPPLKEIQSHAYKVDDRCYKFVPKDMKCPAVGVIEPFQWQIAASGQ